MGLSFKSVQKAYEVFNQLKEEFGTPGEISSWPEDMGLLPEQERKDPELNTVYGWDRKSDNGWENIFFIVENPSKKLKDRFDELAKVVPNSTLNKPYKRNPKLWVLGWF